MDNQNNEQQETVSVLAAHFDAFSAAAELAFADHVATGRRRITAFRIQKMFQEEESWLNAPQTIEIFARGGIADPAIIVYNIIRFYKKATNPTVLIDGKWFAMNEAGVARTLRSPDKAVH